MADNTLVYIAVYDDLDDALDDLNALEILHEDRLIGKVDAAVIDQENGQPRVVKRMARPRIRVIPEDLGSGTLPRKELTDAARELAANQVGLIVIGEPTLGKAFDHGVMKADKVIKRSLDATTDEIASELREALRR
jgi:hypothetical protein